MNNWRKKWILSIERGWQNFKTGSGDQDMSVNILDIGNNLFFIISDNEK